MSPTKPSTIVIDLHLSEELWDNLLSNPEINLVELREQRGTWSNDTVSPHSTLRVLEYCLVIGCDIPTIHCPSLILLMTHPLDDTKVFFWTRLYPPFGSKSSRSYFLLFFYVTVNNSKTYLVKK